MNTGSSQSIQSKSGKRLPSFLLALTLLPGVLLLLCSQQLHAQASTPDTLHVRLDMRGPIGKGWFDASSETVGLRGDHAPLNWGQTFPANDTDGDGIYTAAIPFHIESDSLALSYKIKIDGTANPDEGWQQGRNHRTVIYPGDNKTIALAWEDKPAAYPSTITGNIEVVRNFDSGGLQSRNLYIYLPPGYNKNDRRYPVLYMHDGQNLFDASVSGNEWRMDEAAQQLIKSGEVEPLIIVGIANTPNRIDEYTPTQQHWKHRLNRVAPPSSKGSTGNFTGIFETPTHDTLRVAARNDSLFAIIPGSTHWQPQIQQSDSVFFLPGADITARFYGAAGQPAGYVIATKPPMGGQGNEYGDVIIQRVKPYIDGRYRTRPEAKYTGLGGSSLGGLISLHIGLNHPDVFGRLLIASPSVWWDNRRIISEVQQLASSTGQMIWLDIGTGEGEHALQNTRYLHQALLDKEWDHKRLSYTEAAGAAHSETAWAKRVPDMLRFLYPSEAVNK